MASPAGVAPGSRMTEPGADAGPTGSPQAARRSQSRAAWVLLPHPSQPSRLMRTPRRSLATSLRSS